MKILFCNTHPVYRQTLPWGFAQLGHTVIIPESYDPTYLLSLVEVVEPSLVMMAGWVEDYVPQNLEAIKQAVSRCDAVLVYWATEDVQHLYRWSLPMARRIAADLVLTINEDCVEVYAKYGLAAEYLNFGCNTDLFRPLPAHHDHACDVLLIANHYDLPQLGLYREQSLRDLLIPILDMEDIEVHIWGSNWIGDHRYSSLPIPEQNIKGIAPFELTPLLYSSARLVLGPQNEQHYSTQVTMRTFEALGTGALLLTSSTGGVRSLFKPGHHLLTSRSPEETRELVSVYRKDDGARREIARAGRQLILQHHTYEHRAATVISLVQQQLSARRHSGLLPSNST